MTEKKMSLIDRCKQIDIVDFARNNGMAVVNKGRDYRLEDHDSFVFDRRKQRFYWNSQNISGDIIELAKLFFIDKEIQDPKQQFKAATDFILKNEDKTERVENLHFETEKYKDHPVDSQPLTEKGRNYLKEERKLPDWLIDYAEKEGLIAELKPKHERQNFLVRDDRLDHAVAFLWKDPQTKETVGASYQGTFIDYERFGERGTYKHIDKNSTANHGFNLKIGDPKQLKFFESSIDLLSYAALNRDQLNDTWLVSMEGLKHHVISHYFGEAVSELRKKQAFPQSIEICVDNDRAGHIFYEKEQLMGAVDPFTNQKVRCERGIANDWQVPKEYKDIYEEVAKEMKVEPEAIMAIHKTENNLQLTNQLVSAHKVNASFGQQLSVNDSIEAINLKDICREVAKELKACERVDGTYDFDRFYQEKGDINAQILFSYKAEQYYKGYKNHEHEFVPEVKKDWNDQLKHEIQQQEIRKQKRAMLFQQGRQQERE
ncbi:toprim domain-containing protein [Enterococcus faecium]|uniref:toprim domain-containing protein n=1 Tax=Enterococcus faecium TaxID=1352 RepID=UPI00224D50BB|nr:toprim domain-containing protein [Enterococcus faecium]MCX4062106.1 toprim domain-containing protein [Enterococcus faecium]